MMNIRHKKGFTLSEVMVTVVIVGVIAGLSFPRFTVAVERMRSAEGVSIITALLAAQKRFALENGGAYQNGSGPGSELVDGDLDVDIPASPNFATPIIIAGGGLGNPVAAIARPDPAATNMYILFIDEFGNLWCTDFNGYTFCSKMGY